MQVTMENVSAVTSFIFTAYAELEDHRYLYFVCFLTFYTLILLSNSLLILVICIERSLHEPMYWFICCLAVNGLYGSTSLFPSILHLLQSNDYEISLTACFLQIFFLHSYVSVEFTLLSVMSYDRYVAVCHPLHYHLLMSHRKMCVIIALSWIYPHIYFALYFISTVQQTFCFNFIERLYCANFSVIRLSCLDTTLHSLIGLILLIVFPGPQIAMILFSYAKILKVCLFASKESQAKAFQTCTPHILSLINYMVGGFFEIIQSRFNMTHVSQKVRIFLSLYWLIVTPIFNPVIYGICTQTIRVQIYKLFVGKESIVNPQRRMKK